MHFPITESEDNLHNMDDTLLQSHDKYAEFDSIKKWKFFPLESTEFETEIFISKERLLDGEYLDLSIVYTPYRSMFLIPICLYIKYNKYIQITNNLVYLQIARRWISNDSNQLDITFVFGRNTCVI